MRKFMCMQSSTGYLTGQLLISTPVISEGCFNRSVIFICDHNAQGAMGVIINHPISNIDLSDILKEMEFELPDLPVEISVHFGGPVDTYRGFILHTPDVVMEATMLETEDVVLTANVQMLEKILHGEGPEHSLLALGYAGWEAGQLENEIEMGSWIHVPATKKLIFDTENALKWAHSAKSLGVDLSRFSGDVGHA